MKIACHSLRITVCWAWFSKLALRALLSSLGPPNSTVPVPPGGFLDGESGAVASGLIWWVLGDSASTSCAAMEAHLALLTLHGSSCIAFPYSSGQLSPSQQLAVRLPSLITPWTCLSVIRNIHVSVIRNIALCICSLWHEKCHHLMSAQYLAESSKKCRPVIFFLKKNQAVYILPIYVN